MDRIMRARPSSSMLVALIALFVALSGTAVALDGSNTVFSDDIVNGEVRNADLAADSVGSGKIADRQVKNADLSIGASSSNTIADGGIRGVDVKSDTLTPAHIADVGFLQANTARLVDNNAGGASAGQTLFTIGRVRLTAFCSNNGGGSFTAGISPVLPQDDTGADPRPVLVTDGNGVNADQSIELIPFDVQFVEILNGTDVAAREVSFAILDNEDTSASGVAAVSVDPANKRCVITAQAVG